MHTSSPIPTPSASVEVPLSPALNWAPIIARELEAAGCTIAGLPEHLDPQQAEARMVKLHQQILDRTTPGH